MKASKKMKISNSKAINDFESIVIKYIYPILALKEEKILTNYWSDSNGNITQYINMLLSSKELVIYPSLNDPTFSLNIKLSQIFDEEEMVDRLKVANHIMKEIMSVVQYDYNKQNFPNRFPFSSKRDIYAESRYKVAREIGICSWLGGESIYSLILQLEDWALKTYEGKKVPFSFLIHTKNDEPKDKEQINFIDFLTNKHAAVFTDGITSVIELDYNGNVKKFYSIYNKEELCDGSFAPHRFQAICNESNKDVIGIMLQSNGDLLIFKNKRLQIARINGDWKFFNSKSIVKKIEQFLIDENASAPILSNKIYASLLDVSFSHSGGCIALIKREMQDEAKELYKEDSIAEISNEKINMIKKLISGDGTNLLKFEETDRKLRQELLSLDGATILNDAGEFLAVGAIVHVPGGSDEGGRAAAAKELSRYGMAIKISMDGAITGYRDKKVVFSLL